MFRHDRDNSVYVMQRMEQTRYVFPQLVDHGIGLQRSHLNG